MKGVILAAGSGSRLARRNRRLPKVLLPVGERAIIEHTIDAFAHVGVTDLAVVVGYQADTLKLAVGDGSRHGLRIRYIYNPDYRLGNAVSLYAARFYTEGAPFLLSMADHLVSEALLYRMLDVHVRENVLAVDFGYSPRNAAEGTRVSVDQLGMITHIGKDLLTWNGIDTGVFRFTHAVFEAIDDIIADEHKEYQLSLAVTRMIDLGHLMWARDVSGCFWQDVDTREDLNFAREALAG